MLFGAGLLLLLLLYMTELSQRRAIIICLVQLIFKPQPVVLNKAKKRERACERMYAGCCRRQCWTVRCMSWVICNNQPSMQCVTCLKRITSFINSYVYSNNPAFCSPHMVLYIKLFWPGCRPFAFGYTDSSSIYIQPFSFMHTLEVENHWAFNSGSIKGGLHHDQGIYVYITLTTTLKLYVTGCHLTLI